MTKIIKQNKETSCAFIGAGKGLRGGDLTYVRYKPIGIVTMNPPYTTNVS
jgi:hypothetical protein